MYKILSHSRREIFALKRIKLANVDERAKKGYLNEIKLLYSLRDHSQIIRLFDYEYSSAGIDMVRSKEERIGMNPRLILSLSLFFLSCSIFFLYIRYWNTARLT